MLLWHHDLSNRGIDVPFLFMKIVARMISGWLWCCGLHHGPIILYWHRRSSIPPCSYRESTSIWFRQKWWLIRLLFDTEFRVTLMTVLHKRHTWPSPSFRYPSCDFWLSRSRMFTILRLYIEAQYFLLYLWLSIRHQTVTKNVDWNRIAFFE